MLSHYSCYSLIFSIGFPQRRAFTTLHLFWQGHCPGAHHSCCSALASGVGKMMALLFSCLAGKRKKKGYF